MAANYIIHAKYDIEIIARKQDVANDVILKFLKHNICAWYEHKERDSSCEFTGILFEKSLNHDVRGIFFHLYVNNEVIYVSEYYGKQFDPQCMQDYIKTIKYYKQNMYWPL